MFRRLLPILFIFCCACSANASSFEMHDIGFHFFNVALSSPGFSLTAPGALYVNNIPATGFVGSEESVINLGGSPFITPSDFSPGGFVIVNGTVWPICSCVLPTPGSVAAQVSMSISAGFVTVPITDDPTIVLTAPIALTVSARGTTAPNFTTVFVAGFVGSGTATLTLRQTPSPNNNMYVFQSINYQFDLTPTPEPTTLILLGSGILGAIGANYRRRSGRS